MPPAGECRTTAASGFGSLIREARVASGLTLAGFGVQLGVSRKTIQNWEAGRAVPRWKLFGPIADALGISEQELKAMFPVRITHVAGYRWECSVCGDRGPILHGDDARETAEAEGARHLLRHGLR